MMTELEGVAKAGENDHTKRTLKKNNIKAG